MTLGVGFGWNLDELGDHGVPPARRRTMLREYLEAMRALWTQDEAAYDGEFVKFGASWAWPKPPQGHVPVIIGAGGVEQVVEIDLDAEAKANFQVSVDAVKELLDACRAIDGSLA